MVIPNLPPDGMGPEELEALWLQTRHEDYLRMPELIEELPEDFPIMGQPTAVLTQKDSVALLGHRDGLLSNK